MPIVQTLICDNCNRATSDSGLAPLSVDDYFNCAGWARRKGNVLCPACDREFLSVAVGKATSIPLIDRVLQAQRPVRLTFEHIGEGLVECYEHPVAGSRVRVTTDQFKKLANLCFMREQATEYELLEVFAKSAQYSAGFNPIEGYVYMAKCSEGMKKGKYKIGYSKNPENRMKGVGGKSVQLIAKIHTHNARGFEKYMHNYFHACRDSDMSEWFSLNQDEVKWFSSIAMQSK